MEPTTEAKEPEPEKPKHVFKIRNPGEKLVKLSLYQERLTLEFPDQPNRPTQEVFREEASATIDIMNGLVLRHTLVFKFEKNFNLKLSPDQFKIVLDWMGPPTFEELKAALKSQFIYSIPLGIIMVIAALPLQAKDPNVSHEFDPLIFGLGACALIVPGIAFLFPSRQVFAYQALISAAIAVHQIRHVISQDKPAWHYIIVLIWISVVSTALQFYKRFETIKPQDVQITPVTE